MRIAVVALTLLAVVLSCDSERLYEKNFDFDSRFWLISEQPYFEFVISDSIQAYNLYCNIRNSVSYPYSRLYVNAYLQDSAGRVLQKKMTEVFLFDPKTGKPFGESGIGDIYDHRIPVLNNYTFPYRGKFKMKFEQHMRLDSLQGILAVGLRVEKSRLSQ